MRKLTLQHKKQYPDEGKGVLERKKKKKIHERIKDGRKKKNENIDEKKGRSNKKKKRR